MWKWLISTTCIDEHYVHLVGFTVPQVCSDLVLKWHVLKPNSPFCGPYIFLARSHCICELAKNKSHFYVITVIIVIHIHYHQSQSGKYISPSSHSHLVNFQPCECPAVLVSCKLSVGAVTVHRPTQTEGCIFRWLHRATIHHSVKLRQNDYYGPIRAHCWHICWLKSNGFHKCFMLCGFYIGQKIQNYSRQYNIYHHKSRTHNWRWF